MKENAFIIAEYNPFHTGHLRHIEETKNAGAERVICVMSGNFVQRGDIAFCDKRLRAEFAVRCGADLVLELPLPYVLSGASAFAEGAARIVSACGGDGTLSFGSEYALAQIEEARCAILDPDVRLRASELSREEGKTYPAALHEAAKAFASEDALAPLADPNSVLAIEYLYQFRRICPGVDFYAVKRDGDARHDALFPAREFASAKYIRDTFYRSSEFPEALLRYVPASIRDRLREEYDAGRLPSDREKFSVALMSRLFLLSAGQLREVNGITQGFENRLLQGIRENSDLYALFDAVKTKRFTHARIRQSVLSAAIGVRRSDLEGPLPYVRVLGMNDRGKAYLRFIKKDSPVPFVMNISEAPDCRYKRLDCEAGKLFELCTPHPRNINAEYPVKPFIL